MRDDDRGGRTETDPDRDEWPPAGSPENDDVGRDRETSPTDRSAADLQDESGHDPGRTASSSEPSRGDGSEPTQPPGGSDPEAIRRWSALLFSLAVIAAGTAGAIFVASDAPRAAGGASVLALVFGAVGLLGRTAAPSVLGHLDDAWTEHRPYVWFSAGVFAVGVVLGVALYAAGVDLVDFFLEMITQEFGEEELPGEVGDPTGELPFEPTATFFIQNNTPPFLASIAGALTLGVVTLLIMGFNGVLIGNIGAVVGSETGFGLIVALIGPHGIFELPALFIAAGVGFRFVHRLGQRVFGSRDALFTRSYLLRTTLFVVFGWLLLVLAAFVEAYVTLLIADTLVPL
ncbi:stage II sporulation protein M [Haloterrigena alkaliphila]|uniref:Stage II sporulation protein M n=1 Tax=Haloterrigena alkaliphila TaxID=2816475 RepID=A0A8A2VFB5_9EURY|nr:stage II sporulation protein M [Haloterrigena alkaliphila]QSX00740.1 stage II sporulation protein M [Haloterrigena alkaliphila]